MDAALSPRSRALRKIFQHMDANGDGVIDELEGVAIGRLLNGGSADAGQRFWQQLLLDVDTDVSGDVSLTEYLAYGRKVYAPSDTLQLEIHLQRLEENASRQARQTQQTDLVLLEHRLLAELDTRYKAQKVFSKISRFIVKAPKVMRQIVADSDTVLDGISRQFLDETEWAMPLGKSARVHFL